MRLSISGRRSVSEAGWKGATAARVEVRLNLCLLQEEGSSALLPGLASFCGFKVKGVVESGKSTCEAGSWMLSLRIWQVVVHPLPGHAFSALGFLCVHGATFHMWLAHFCPVT